MLFDHLQQLEHESGQDFVDGLCLKAYIVKKHFKTIERITDFYHPHYTFHDHRHSDSVLHNVYHITEKASLLAPSSAYGLTRFEAFFLIAAAYLHDVGMLYIRPDDRFKAKEQGKSLSEIIRADHHLRSVEYIQEHRRSLYLDSTEANILGLVCKGHRCNVDLSDLSEYGDRPAPDRTLIRVALLAALLRIADELDLDHNRAPEDQRELIEQGEALDSISRYHWMKHFYTEGVSFGVREAPTRVVEINVSLLVPDQPHYDYVSAKIKRGIQGHLEGIDKLFLRNGFELRLSEPIRFKLQEDLKRTMYRSRDLRVLYVDDEPMARQQALRGFRKRGFQCDVAEDSSSALRRMATPEAKYHQVVLDMDMPDLYGNPSPRAGADLLPAIARLDPDALITIFTSHYDEPGTPELMRECVLQGAGFLSKDVGIECLIDQITELLQNVYIIIEQLGGVEAMEMKEFRPDPYRVLVADDDDVQAGAYMHELEKTGIQVKRAISGQEAVQKLKEQQPFHVIVIDRIMPDISGNMSDMAGLELAEYVGQQYPDISCFILTSVPELKSYKASQKIDSLLDYAGKDEMGPRELAARVPEIFDRRLVPVYRGNGFPEKADPLFFYNQSGEVEKTVSDSIGQEAGVVRLESGDWKATVEKGAIELTLKPGREVVARAIRKGAIVVVPRALRSR